MLKNSGGARSRNVSLVHLSLARILTVHCLATQTSPRRTITANVALSALLCALRRHVDFAVGTEKSKNLAFSVWWSAVGLNIRKWTDKVGFVNR